MESPLSIVHIPQQSRGKWTNFGSLKNGLDIDRVIILLVLSLSLIIDTYEELFLESSKAREPVMPISGPWTLGPLGQIQLHSLILDAATSSTLMSIADHYIIK